jgi:hypothetical protein
MTRLDRVRVYETVGQVYLGVVPEFVMVAFQL